MQPRDGLLGGEHYSCRVKRRSIAVIGKGQRMSGTDEMRRKRRSVAGGDLSQQACGPRHHRLDPPPPVGKQREGVVAGRKGSEKIEWTILEKKARLQAKWASANF